MAKRITDEDLRLNLIINGDDGKKEMLELERQMKDFSYREFEASPTAEREGICNVITSFAVRDAVKELTLKVLQPLRDKVGHPLRINSGYRCPELNRAVAACPHRSTSRERPPTSQRRIRSCWPRWSGARRRSGTRLTR